MECHRWFLALAEILDVMTAAYAECMQEQFALHSTGVLYLVHHTHIDLFPETGNGRHTGRMCVTHRLLYLLRMRVDNHACSGIHTQNGPATFKDMRIRQEVHDAVVFVDRHTLAVGHYGGVELSMRQDDTFRVARCTAGIEDVGNVIIGSFLLQFLHFRLTGQILAQFQEIAEIDGIGIVCRDVHHGVEDDDTLQRRTKRKNATGLVVLVLFTDKEEANLGIVDHKLDLLLRAGSIERDGYCTNAPGTEVAFDILYRILRENTNVLLYLHTQVQQGIRHLLNGLRHLVPRQ